MERCAGPVSFCCCSHTRTVWCALEYSGGWALSYARASYLQLACEYGLEEVGQRCPFKIILCEKLLFRDICMVDTS